MAGAGDEVQLLERLQPVWTVKRVTMARLTRRISNEEAAMLATMPELAEGWQTAFAKMAGGNREEDTTTRLKG